jgi:hypothetical protein
MPTVTPKEVEFVVEDSVPSAIPVCADSVLQIETINIRLVSLSTC